MRPTPRLFHQVAKAPSMMQRLSASPMKPPAEAYPLFVLIAGMLSFGAYSAYREIRYDKNLRLQRQNAAAYLSHAH
ncbi:hypothetical protein N0V93_007983 [Gnomoniopsis smithogilvyi]|uniref:Uncharacterized protein n=1 Tax=Gnomoniopsis smithogilvyi TaxID=1191159 RepID=A0A9W9CUC2_9PEZI|nr:hypothetical protein N0V93_007983 [Gnomoniopsis smithogilvyi]